MRRAIFGLFTFVIGSIVAFAQCPIVFTGSYCEIPNGYAGQASMFYCTGPTTGGPYFDSASLRFTPNKASRSVSTTCGNDENNSCYYCYLNTITVSGMDCNGNTQKITHTTCCEYSP